MTRAGLLPFGRQHYRPSQAYRRATPPRLAPSSRLKRDRSAHAGLPSRGMMDAIFPIGGRPMSVARVTEITAASPVSFEDAIKVGIDRANKTLRNVKGAWVQEQTVSVEDGVIKEYRVNMKVTFILED